MCVDGVVPVKGHACVCVDGVVPVKGHACVCVGGVVKDVVFAIARPPTCKHTSASVPVVSLSWLCKCTLSTCTRIHTQVIFAQHAMGLPLVLADTSGICWEFDFP